MAALELIVIDRALGSQDESASLEEQADKILYFKCPQDGVSVNQQLSMLTLVEGLIEFTTKFSNKAIETALLDRKVWCFHECEPDTWLVASFPMQATTPSNPKALHASLVQLYDCYRLLFGRIHDQVNMSHFDNLQKMRKKVRKAQAAIYLQSQNLDVTEDIINDVFEGKDYSSLPAALVTLFDDYFDLKASLRNWLISPLHTLPALRDRLSAFMTWYSYYGAASDGTFLSGLPKSLNAHYSGPCRAALVHRIQRVLKHQLGDLLLGCAVYHDGGLLWSDFDDVLTSSLSHFLQLLDVSHLLALREMSDDCLSGGLSSSSQSPSASSASISAPASALPSSSSSFAPPASLHRSGSTNRPDAIEEVRRDAKIRLLQDLLSDRLSRSGVALTSWQSLGLEDATVDLCASERSTPLRGGSGKQLLPTPSTHCKRSTPRSRHSFLSPVSPSPRLTSPSSPFFCPVLDGVRTADGRDTIAFPLLHTWTNESVESVCRALCFLSGRLVIVVGLDTARVRQYHQTAIQQTLSRYLQDPNQTLVALSQFMGEASNPTPAATTPAEGSPHQDGTLSSTPPDNEEQQEVIDADDSRILSIQVTHLAQRLQRALSIDVVRPFRKVVLSSLEPLLPHGSPSTPSSHQSMVSSVSLSSASGSVSGREGSVSPGGWGTTPYSSTPPFPRAPSNRRTLSFGPLAVQSQGLERSASSFLVPPPPPPPLPPAPLLAASSSSSSSQINAGNAQSTASALAVIVSAREVAIGSFTRATNTFQVLSARDVLELIVTGGEPGSGSGGSAAGSGLAGGGGGGGGGGSSSTNGGGSGKGVDLLDWLVKKYSQLRSPVVLYYFLIVSLIGRSAWRCLNAVWKEMACPTQQSVVQRVSTAQRGGLWAVGFKLHADLHAEVIGESAPEVVVVAMVRSCPTVHELHDLTEQLAREIRLLVI